METIITILTSIFGSAVIIGFLQNLLINSLSQIHKNNNEKVLEEIRTINQENLRNLEHKYQKQIEDHKITLNNYVRYSDEQFKLYNEFWSSLTDLKQKADDLWKHADNQNLIAFAKQLRETKEKVEKARLFIEENHYQQLKRILLKFSDYSFGKKKLINLRNDRIESGQRINPREIENLIDSNGNLKNHYDKITEEIFLLLRNQIYFSKPNGNN